MKILHKLLLGLVIIVFIVGVIGFVSIQESNKAFTKSIGEDSVLFTVQMMREVDARIYHRIENFKEYSKSLPLQYAISKSNQDFERLTDIQRYIDEKDREWISAPKETITPFMKELIDNDVSDFLRAQVGFFNREYKYTIFGEVFVTNKYGANVGQTSKTSDYRQDDEEWWQLAKKDGFYMRDIAYDESAGVYSTDIGIKIDDEKGNFIGIMKVVLNIQDTLKDMEKAEGITRYKRTKIILINKEGKCIFSSGGEKFLTDLSNKAFFKKIDFGTGFFRVADGKAGEGDKLFVYSRSTGYEDYKGLGWILILEYDAGEIFEPISKLNRRIEFLFTGMIIFVVIIGYLILKNLSSPIEKLRAAAVEIGNGKLDTSIEIHTKDEIGDLASVIGHMTDELKRLATTDRLTQAYNRVKFEEVIQKEMERAKRYRRSLSLAIFDIDYFKRINDTYGHSVGDYILKEIANIIQKNIRATTYLFRWGGEEFVILIPEVDLEGAKIHAERLRKALEDHDFGEAGTITASFGVSHFEDGDSADTFLKKADAALYRAKSNGRNRVETTISVA